MQKPAHCFDRRLSILPSIAVQHDDLIRKAADEAELQVQQAPRLTTKHKPAVCRAFHEVVPESNSSAEFISSRSIISRRLHMNRPEYFLPTSTRFRVETKSSPVSKPFGSRVAFNGMPDIIFGISEVRLSGNFSRRFIAAMYVKGAKGKRNQKRYAAPKALDHFPALMP